MILPIVYGIYLLLCLLPSGSAQGAYLGGGYGGGYGGYGGYGGAAAGHANKVVGDAFRRGYESRNHAAQDSVDAKKIRKSYDRKNSAHEAAKSAVIGAKHGGKYAGGIGSAGAAKKKLVDQFDRGYHDASVLSSLKLRSNEWDSKVDKGATRAAKKARSIIGSVDGSNGQEAKKLFQARHQRASKGRHDKKAILNADSGVKRFDRGVISKAGVSAASINQHAGLHGAHVPGGYGAGFGSHGKKRYVMIDSWIWKTEVWHLQV
jgi:hypothetical protein